MADSQAGIVSAVDPVLSSAGLELWDVEITHDTVRVLVDRPGGIDLDVLSQAAGTLVAPILDAHPELTPQGRYHLEVSSPGIERKLRRPEHFARYIGAEISLKTRVEISGGRRHRGVVIEALPAGVVVEMGEPPVQTLVEYDSIDWARTVASWSSTLKQKPTVNNEPKEAEL